MQNERNAVFHHQSSGHPVLLEIRRTNGLISSSGPEGESCPLSVKDYLTHQQSSAQFDARFLHVVSVSPDRERKAALDFGICGLRVWIL